MSPMGPRADIRGRMNEAAHCCDLCRVMVAARINSFQCALLNYHRVKLAHAHNIDDGGGDYFSYGVIPICETEIA